MLQFIRLIFAIVLIVLVVSQTKKENLLVEKIHESGFFSNYGEAKSFINLLTWSSIFLFIFITTF